MSLGFAGMHDIGKLIRGAFAIPNTAETGGAHSEITGLTVNRNLFGDRGLSAKVIMAAQATMQSGETLTFVVQMQDSADGSAWADYQTAHAAVTAVDSAGGAVVAVEGTAEFPVNIRGARQYLRVQSTAALSRGATDTTVFFGVLVLGGFDQLPPAAGGESNP